MNPAKVINIQDRKPKENEADLVFRKNYENLTRWEKEFWSRYRAAKKAMDALFVYMDQEWRNPDDHLPQFVHIAMESIIDKINKKEK